MNNKKNLDMTSKKTLYKDELIIIHKDEKNDLLTITWSNQCTNILKDDIENKTDIIQKTVSEHNPPRILMNLYFCDYFIEPDNYRWYEKTMFSIINLENQVRLAIIVPQNLFVHASFEAARIALEKQKVSVQYFIDEEKANHWLMQQ